VRGIIATMGADRRSADPLWPVSIRAHPAAVVSDNRVAR
jgi:hypothetical protein